MIGAVIGDTVGSVYEFNNIKTTEFPLFDSESNFTDDISCTFVFVFCNLTLYFLEHVVIGIAQALHFGMRLSDDFSNMFALQTALIIW